VWLPEGEAWVGMDGERIEGGQWITARAPLESIPFYARAGTSVLVSLFAA
jgi:alpha-D-xyloside xylohydrolase